MRSLVLLLAVLSFALSDDFSSQAYFNKPANEKMRLLWNKITENQTPLGFYSAITTATIFLEGMSESFDWLGDEMLDGRKKLIHTVGKVAKVKFVSSGDHPYTGVFQGCENVLLRGSVAKEQDNKKTSAEGAFENFTPGLGIKFLRDGHPSANVQVMFGVNGQKSWNFFKNDFANHIPAADGLALKLLAKKFSSATDYVQTVGLRDLALINEKGDVSSPVKYPFRIILKPSDDLRKGTVDYFTVDYMDQLGAIAPGTLLYNVYAMDQPNQQERLIGQFVTTSEFVSSRWGDETLFFRHNLMDIDLKENPAWEKYVPKFHFFGSSKTEGEVKKCPFLSK